ncbi:MAG TPA: T9SS type A sorting domain-containing protein [Bacteroidia bacterium]|nr:T9SS type A sorting domain-containing protein [Bacteroidia bacterium]
MKKALLFLSLFVAGMTGIQAQCTITPSCTVTSGYCSTPAAGSSLPNATELVAYSTVIQVTIGTTYSVATINNATVTAVTGLPSGLSYSLNPTSGVINGGSSGCMLISGTPAAGSAGTYSVTANVTANTSFGPFPTTIVWTLTVSAAAGIVDLSANPSNLVIVPNPAKSEVNLTSDFHFQTIRVFDALGNLSMTQEVNGAYKALLDLGKLNAGIYFLQVTDGNKIVTRKFIKE